MDRRRCGFTLVELLMVILIIGILARLALPAYQSLVFKARTVEALGNISVVRVAACSYNADTNRYPETGLLIGVSMTTSDERLGQALIELVGESAAAYSIEEHYTFILAAG